MRLLLLFLLLPFVGIGQTPPGYTKINARYDWLAGKFDSAFHIPGYATVPNIRTGGWVGSGNIGVDTVAHRLYFYSGGSWRYSTAGTGGGGWGLTGNSGTTAGTNFIGTTDAIDFVGKTNGTEMFRFKYLASQIQMGYGASAAGDSAIAIGVNSNAPTTNAIAIGPSAGRGGSGTGNIYIGKSTGINTTGNTNTFIGNFAGGNSSGTNGTGVGTNSLLSNTGTSVTGFGYRSGQSNTGNDIVALGYEALWANTAGQSVGIGHSSGEDNAGVASTMVGYSSGAQNAGDSLVAFGYNAGVNNLLDNVILIGNTTSAVAANQAVIGNASITSTRLHGAIYLNNIAGTSGQVPVSAGTGGPPVWTTPTVALSGVTGSGANTVIDNGAFTEEWQHSTLAGNAFTLSSSTTVGGAAHRLLLVNLTGANGTASTTSYGAYFNNTHTGTTPVNNGIYVVAGGGSAGATNTAITGVASGTAATNTAALFSAVNATTNNAINIAAGALALNGSAGTSGQVLTSAGANTLPTWSTVSAGITGSGAATRIAVWDGASSQTGYAGFTHSGSATNPVVTIAGSVAAQLSIGITGSSTADFVYTAATNDLSLDMAGGFPVIIYWKQSTNNTGINGITNPNSRLHVGGSFAVAYVAKTGNYTVTEDDYTIEVTANSPTITLPTAVGITGRLYYITNSGAGTVTLATTSSQTFVNVVATPTSLTLATLTGATVQSNGANWLKVSSF